MLRRLYSCLPLPRPPPAAAQLDGLSYSELKAAAQQAGLL